MDNRFKLFYYWANTIMTLTTAKKTHSTASNESKSFDFENLINNMQLVSDCCS